MKLNRLSLLALVACSALTLSYSLQKKAAEPGASDGLVLKNTAPEEFHATPIMPQCFMGAMQRFNPQTGAAVFLVRVEAKDGCLVPLHWHTAGEQITVVSGHVTLQMADGASVELKEGGYAYVPSKHLHVFRCSGPCVHFVQSDGPYDIHYVDKEGKELSLADALKAAGK